MHVEWFRDRQGGVVNYPAVQGTILSLVDVLMFKPDTFRVCTQLSSSYIVSPNITAVLNFHNNLAKYNRFLKFLQGWKEN